MKMFFKRVMKLLVAVALTLFLVVGCSSDNKGETNDGEGKVKNIMFVVTGNLGGGTNNDDVYATIQKYTDSVGGNVDTFEANMDTSLFETTLMQAAETGEYDLIITGFGTMVEPLSNTAAKYPDQKFFIFDTEMDFSDGKNANVISVQALQNEGGFLAGVLAALVTTSDAELANEDKKVGFVGAIESVAIEDFLIGYIEGVNYVDSTIEVLYSFVGNHTDSALAKEIGLTQFQQGADVVFAVGGNGLGVAQAALDANGYAIGVDFDYSERLKTTSPATAAHILTSVIKDYRMMIEPILAGINEGTINWGSHSYITYGDGGVYLVNNDYTKAIVSDEISSAFSEVETLIKEGKIDVSTAFKVTSDQIDKIKELAKSFE